MGESRAPCLHFSQRVSVVLFRSIEKEVWCTPLRTDVRIRFRVRHGGVGASSRQLDLSFPPFLPQSSTHHLSGLSCQASVEVLCAVDLPAIPVRRRRREPCRAACCSPSAARVHSWSLQPSIDPPDHLVLSCSRSSLPLELLSFSSIFSE